MAQLIYKSNKEIALVCGEIGYFLEMDGVAFKPRAYEKVAEAIFDLSEDVFDVYRLGGLKALENISGVGVSIAEKIEEFFKTGKIGYLESFKKRWPVKINEFMNIEGVGPKTVRHLYEELGIKNLRDLEIALSKNKISGLEGFGEKSQEKILKSIEFHKRSGGRAILGFIMPEIKKLEEKLKTIKGVERVDIAGSVRRKKETIGDIDILVTINGNRPAFAKATAGKTRLSLSCYLAHPFNTSRASQDFLSFRGSSFLEIGIFTFFTGWIVVAAELNSMPHDHCPFTANFTNFHDIITSSYG